MTAAIQSRRRPLLGFELIDDFAQQSQSREPVPAPIGDTCFRVVARVQDKVREDLVEPLDMELSRNPSGVWLFAGLVRTRSERMRLARGRYVVRITSRYYRSLDAGDPPVSVAASNQDGHADPVHFPPSGPAPKLHSFRLFPSYAYPFPVQRSIELGSSPTILRGAVRQPAGSGVTGAEVEIRGDIPPGNRSASDPVQWTDRYSTDRTGQWLFVLPDKLFVPPPPFDPVPPVAEVDITVNYPDEQTPPAIAQRIHVEQWKEEALKDTSIRGLLQTSAGHGILGATITVRSAPANAPFPGSTVTDRDGRFFYNFRFDQFIGDTNPKASVFVIVRLPGGDEIQKRAEIDLRKVTNVTLDTN